MVGCLSFASQHFFILSFLCLSVCCVCLCAFIFASMRLCACSCGCPGLMSGIFDCLLLSIASLEQVLLVSPRAHMPS